MQANPLINKGSKSFSSQTLCNTSYNDTKPESNYGEAGDSLNVWAQSGLSISDQTKVPGEYLTACNNKVDFSKILVGQPICYSEGNLPNLKPSKNNDGTCSSYVVKSQDSCSAIAAYYSMTIPDLKNLNVNLICYIEDLSNLRN